jgi:hypothetical protein
VAIGQTTEAKSFSKEMGGLWSGRMVSTYCFVFGAVDPNWKTGDYGETLLLWWLRCWKFEAQLCYDLGFSG